MIVIKKMIALTFINKSELIVSKLNKLYIFNLQSERLIEVFRFETSFFTFLSSFSSVLRRLFRKDIRLALNLDDDSLLLVKDKNIYCFDKKSNIIKSRVALPRGSRPLNFTKIDSLEGFADGIYFGEYFTNPCKLAVKIFKYSIDNGLQEVYEFPEGTMNHIHNLVVDKYRNCLWLLAGDTDEAASIYQIKDNFKSIVRVVYGQQVFRSCVLFPIQEGLLYATDSQYEKNSIRLLKEIGRNTWVSEHVFNLNGPCIFGARISGTYFFSTSVEGLNNGNFLQQFIRNKRGPGIVKNQSDIIAGNLKMGFKTVYSNGKDIFPFVLFQFGNIIFPTGDNESDKLIFTNVALKKNDCSTILLNYEFQ
jgi:hypothetical protein